MDFDTVRKMPGTTAEILKEVQEKIMALVGKKKQYSWEDKIDNLVRMAKLVGTYLEVEIEDPGSDGHKETRKKLKEAYKQFCEWRHDEPYVVDEIKALIDARGER